VSERRSTRRPLASVVINNHDYGRFVGEAIESALAQSHQDVEVVVVDDGSTDDSRDVIAGYAGRAAIVLQPCRGQAAACNAGYAYCRGDAVVFLDADDVLDADAVAAAVDALGPGVARAQWHQRMIDEHGRPAGVFPAQPLASGDLRSVLLHEGPLSFPSAPMSANAFSRAALDALLPMPEDEYRICADSFLHAMTPLFGEVRTLARPHGTRRVHGGNYTRTALDHRLERALATWASDCRWVRQRLAAIGEAPTGDWGANPFVASMRRMRTALRVVEEHTAEGDGVVLVGGAPATGCVAITGRRPVAFDAHRAPDVAIDRCRADGATHIAVTWLADRWLRTDQVAAAFKGHMSRVAATDDVTVFALGR
jgi:hypothetical protein